MFVVRVVVQNRVGHSGVWDAHCAAVLGGEDHLSRVDLLDPSGDAFGFDPGFSASEGTYSSDHPVDQAGEQGAEPLVWSEHFPTWGFKRKYAGGRLYRDWDELVGVLQRRSGGQPSCALVFPCAPLQLLEIESA